MFAAFITKLGGWLYPPALPDTLHTVGEIQRQRIGRFLPPIVGLALMSYGIVFPPLLQARVSVVILLMLLLLPTVVGFLSLWLLHCRQAQQAAYLLTTTLAALELFLALYFPVPDTVTIISPTSRLFLPIFIAGVLLSARASWFYASIMAMGIIIGDMLVWHSALRILMACAVPVGTLFIGTGLVSLLVMSFGHRLREADYSVELAALNQQLAASVAEIAAREQESSAQHEFLTIVLESIAPDVFFITDATGHLLRCNDALIDLIGWSRDELIGGTTAKLHASVDDYLAVAPKLALAAMKQGRARQEHDYRTKDGRTVLMEINMAWVARLHIFIAVARDITMRSTLYAQAQTALEESERARNELTTIFDTVQDSLVVFDLQRNILFMNRGGRQLFHISDGHDEDLQTTIESVQLLRVDGSVIPDDEFPTYRVLHGQPATHLLAQFAQPLYQRRMVSAHAAPFYGAHGEMIGALSVLRDVTAEYRNARHIQIMRNVASACASAADVRTLANAAINELLDGLGATNGILVIADAERPGFAQVMASRLSDQISAKRQLDILAEIEHTSIAPDAPLGILATMATGMPLFAQADSTTQRPFPVMNFVPLRFEGTVTGAIGIAYDQESGEENETDLLLAVADQIATAMHRAQLYEEARRLASYDPLTGLRNHRALQDILQQELRASAAQSLPVSLLMMDVDHLSKLNNIYGHNMGDQALGGIAHVIRRLIGVGDYAARYGGEEFVMVLPNADEEQAHVLAQQLCDAIAQQPCVTDHATGQPIAITVSLGHATYPLHASAAASLLKAADLALFAAKRAGRNRVVAYSPLLLTQTLDIPVITPASISDASEITLPTGTDLAAVQALITAIDLRDGYTAAHSEGVARYAVALGHELALPTEQIEALHLGGLVHDVGKIGVPDEILRKPGKLTDEEWVSMRAHTTMGEIILRPVEQLRHLLPLVRWHHERLDGSGYPDGLKGDDIPFLVRILAVADVFDAFTAERPYHPGRSALAGLQLLQREAQDGRMDEAIVMALTHILQRQGLVEIQRYGEHDLQEAA